MADLILATSTYAVGTADSASTIVNNVTAQDAQHINGPVSAILQIESVLGNAPGLIGSKADLASRLAVSLNPDGTLIKSSSVFEVGDVCTSMRTSKAGWLLMDGTERSNTTYEDLLAEIITRLGSSAADTLRTGLALNCTVDHTLDQFTATAHGLNNNEVVYFGASSVPSGLGTLTRYYVVNKTANTFQVSTSLGGVALALSSNGSGVTFHKTFICDARGVSPLGADNMGGSSRNKATDTAADNVGQGGGSESSVASHTHGITDPGHVHPSTDNALTAPGNYHATGNVQGSPGSPSQVTGITINSTGTSTGNMHPYFTVNYFIKY